MPDESGIEAAEGTVAHMVADRWQKSGVPPKSLIGTTVVQDGYEITIDRDMLEYVSQYIAWCEELEGEHEAECHVDLSRLFPIPNQGGRLDHTACMPGVLTVTDLKFGKQIRVFAKRNPQLMLYALGKYFELNWLYSFKKIVIRICQPRQDHFDVWECDVEDLLIFAGYVAERARQAWRLDAVRTPSADACDYCALSDSCGARLRWLERLVNACFADMDLEVTSDESAEAVDDLRVGLLNIDPQTNMTVEDMGRLLKHRLVLEKWLTGMFKTAEAAAVNDHRPIPEHKVVESMTRRDYLADIDTVVGSVEQFGLSRDDVVITKLITPPDLEKKLTELGVAKKQRDAVIAPLVYKPRGHITIAPLSDRRREYEDDNLDGAFENYEDAAEDL